MTGLEPVQGPLSQLSLCVHALPSLHAVPLGFAGFEHCPVAVSQVPATWHWSCAVQTTGLEPVQVPLSQVSLSVHALPSVHAVPLGFAGFEHCPVDVSQVPATWHWSCAVQVIAFDPVQVPLSQVSLSVHALPSVHTVPLGFAGFEHCPVDVSQVPATWHWSCAVQVIA